MMKMNEPAEKTWWLQLRDNPDRLIRVKLTGRDEEWICLETVSPVRTETGWGMEAYALKRSEFDISWRTWKIMPTMGMLRSLWTGRKNGYAGAGGAKDMAEQWG